MNTVPNKVEKAVAKTKAYKMTISGSYLSSKGEPVDFEKVVGYVPLAEMQYAEAMVRARYAEMWIKKSEKYTDRVQIMREVYVDSAEETTYDFSYIGKDIKELSYEELQDVATAKGLRAIPLYKTGGLRSGRTIAYAVYSSKIGGKKLTKEKAEQKFASLPPMIVTGNIENHITRPLSNEDVLGGEETEKSAEGEVVRTSMTRSQMEELAAEKSISYNPAISDAKLYAKIINE